MKAPRRSTPSPTLSGGGEQAWRPSLGYLAIAVGIASSGLTYLFMSSASAPDLATSTSAPAPLVSQTAGVAAAGPGQATVKTPELLPRPQAAREAPREADGVDPTPDLSAYVNPGEKPTMNEVIDRLHQAGVDTGLAAFSPPGTKPALVGLAVPENFALPPGYVRHHQATDDGQRIEAVLMFAPDYQPLDANNQPIALPQNRVVPPELAPPGFPTRRVVIPPSIEPSSSGR